MAASIAWSPVASTPLGSLTGRCVKREALTAMGHWIWGRARGASEQQLQKKEAAEDGGGEGNLDAQAGLWGNRGGSFGAWCGNGGDRRFASWWSRRGEGNIGARWGDGGQVVLGGLSAFNQLENELSNCCVSSGQGCTSRVGDIGTALQLHSASAICKLGNDVDTLFSFVALLGFLLTGCVIVTIARHALHANEVLCFRFIVGAIACLFLAALACKMVSLVIK